MAVVGVSEFTFGFAFLYEQSHANWGGLTAAPVLPSLQEEQNVGWDAHLPLIGTDFYYQFKLSDYLVRGNAKYFNEEPFYTGPYYRIALHRRDNNRQHQRLREHSIDNPHTYYVAPEFRTLDAFNHSFLNHQVTNRSRLIALSDCDDVIDGAQHHITYQEGIAGFHFHSESKRREKSYFGEALGEVYRATQPSWEPIDKGFAVRLFDKTREIVRRSIEREESTTAERAVPLLDFAPLEADRRTVLLRTSEILSVVLGVTLVVVGAAQ